jgi:hypothetical protein
LADIGTVVSEYLLEIALTLVGLGLLVNMGLKENKGLFKKEGKKIGGWVGIFAVIGALLSVAGAFGLHEGSTGFLGGMSPNDGIKGPPTPGAAYQYNVEAANNFGVTYVDWNERRIVSSSTVNYTADSVSPAYIEPQFTFQRTDTLSSDDDDAVLQVQIIKLGTFSDSSGDVHNLVSKDADMRAVAIWEDSTGATKCRGLDVCAYPVNRGASTVGYLNITLTVVGADVNSFTQYRDYVVLKVKFTDPGGWSDIWTIYLTATTINS